MGVLNNKRVPLFLPGRRKKMWELESRQRLRAESAGRSEKRLSVRQWWTLQNLVVQLVEDRTLSSKNHAYYKRNLKKYIILLIKRNRLKPSIKLYVLV